MTSCWRQWNWDDLDLRITYCDVAPRKREPVLLFAPLAHLTMSMSGVMGLWLQKYDLKYTEVHVCEAKKLHLGKDCKLIVTIT